MGPTRDSEVAGALYLAPQLMWSWPWELLLSFWPHYPLEVDVGHLYNRNFEGVGQFNGGGWLKPRPV